MARPSNIKREAILAVARPMFIEKGVAATEMTDIAKACGIGRSSLYRYFDSKESLALALAGEILDTLTRRCDFTPPVQASGCQAVETSLRAFVQAMKDNVGMVRFLDDFDSYFCDGYPPSAAAARYQLQMSRPSPAMTDAVRRGVKDKSLRLLNGRDGAFTLRFMTNALLAMAQRVLPRAAILRQEQGYAEEYLDTLLDVMLDNLKPPKERRSSP